MPDKVKYERILNIECLFLDGDTRTITLKKPRNDISTSEIEELETFIKENKILIGDRDASDFRRIKKVVKRNLKTTYLDLE